MEGDTVVDPGRCAEWLEGRGGGALYLARPRLLVVVASAVHVAVVHAVLIMLSDSIQGDDWVLTYAFDLSTTGSSVLVNIEAIRMLPTQAIFHVGFLGDNVICPARSIYPAKLDVVHGSVRAGQGTVVRRSHASLQEGMEGGIQVSKKSWISAVDLLALKQRGLEKHQHVRQQSITDKRW